MAISPYFNTVLQRFISFQQAVARGSNVSRHAATTLRDVFINFHQSSYFFIVAPLRRRVRLFFLHATPLSRHVMLLKTFTTHHIFLSLRRCVRPNFFHATPQRRNVMFL